MEKKANQKNDSETTVKAAVITGIFAIIGTCVSGLFGIIFTVIGTLPEIQRLSIPTEVLSFITIILSIIVVSIILVIAITSYIRNQTRLANIAIVKLEEKEKNLFQEIENETTSLIAEKV